MSRIKTKDAKSLSSTDLDNAESEEIAGAKQKKENSLRQNFKSNNGHPGHGKKDNNHESPHLEGVSSKEDQYLIPGGMGWGLRNGEHSRPHHIFQSMEQAIQYAEKIADRHNGRLIIVEKSGKIKKKEISEPVL